MLVVDAQYQTKCLVTLYKCAELSRNDQEDSSEKVLYGILFFFRLINILKSSLLTKL